MRLVALTVLLLSGLHAHVASAQELSPSSRVRITVSSPGPPEVGRVDSLRGDQLWITSARGASHSLSLVGATTIERSRGRSIGKKMLLGALIGGAATTLAVLIADKRDPCPASYTCLRYLAIPAGFLGGGVVGLTLAKEQWSIVPRERWASGGQPQQLHLGVRIPVAKR